MQFLTSCTLTTYSRHITITYLVEVSSCYMCYYYSSVYHQYCGYLLPNALCRTPENESVAAPKNVGTKIRGPMAVMAGDPSVTSNAVPPAGGCIICVFCMRETESATDNGAESSSGAGCPRRSGRPWTTPRVG
jgi:hypothetical protein